VGHQDLMEHQGQVDHQVLMETSSDQAGQAVLTDLLEVLDQAYKWCYQF
jgi:hypothetical protein